MTKAVDSRAVICISSLVWTDGMTGLGTKINGASDVIGVREFIERGELTNGNVVQ